MGLCKGGGGNDYICCILCGVEYEYAKGEPPPPCGKEKRIRELLEKKAQIDRDLAELYLAKPRS